MRIKKILSILLVCAMTVPMLLVGTCAAATPTITVGSAVATPGQTVELPVKFSNNPGINAFILGIDYDKTKLSFEGAALAYGIPGSFTCEKKAVWANGTNVAENGTFFILKFTVLSNASAGDAQVSITCSNGDVSNSAIQAVDFTTVAGKITVQNTLNPTTAPAFTVANKSAYKGDSVAVEVSISNNPGICAFTLDVDYDKTALRLDSAVANTSLGGMFEYAEKAVWVGNNDTTFNGTAFTLNFTVLASSGTAPVSVSYKAGDISTYDEASVEFACVAGSVEVLQREPSALPTFTVANASARRGSLVDVDVTLSNNTGISAFILDLSYDKAKLQLVGATTALAFGGTTEFTENRVAWANNTDVSANGKVLTLSFNVLSGAAAGSTAVSLSCEEGNISNANEISVDASFVTGYVTISSEAAYAPKLTVSEATAEAGNEVELEVSISDNPGICSFILGIDYDETALRLDSVTVNSALGGQFSYSNKAVWVGSADTKLNGKILTLKFTVLSTATAGDTAVTVTCGERGISNYMEVPVAVEIVAGKVTVTKTQSYVVGDLDGDGKLTAIDANMMKKIVSAKLPTDIRGDMNGDNKVTAADVNLLKKKISGGK